MKFSNRTLALVPVFAPALVAIAISSAMATTTGGAIPGAGGAGGAAQPLPWEGALGTLAAALTGNTAKIIAIIAIFVAGIALIFGEDLGQFAKRLLMIVIAVAFLVGAGSFVGQFVNGSIF